MAWSDAQACVDRLAILHHVIRRGPRRAGAGDAHREPQATLPVAVGVALHLAVGMHIDQAGDQRLPCGIDELGIAVRRRALSRGRDRRDPVTFNDDVDIVTIVRPRTVPQTSDTDDHSLPGRSAR